MLKKYVIFLYEYDDTVGMMSTLGSDSCEFYSYSGYRISTFLHLAIMGKLLT